MCEVRSRCIAKIHHHLFFLCIDSCVEREKKVRGNKDGPWRKKGDPPAKTQSYLKMKFLYTNKVGMPHAHAININDYNSKTKG
jgi:hypothetical protein